MANEKSGSKIMMFGVLLLLGLGIFYLGSLMGKQDVTVNTANQVEHTISVGGEAVKKVSPDQLVLSFVVESKGMEMAASQERNAEIVGKIKEALTALGIGENEIATGYFSIYPEYDTVPVYGQSAVAPDYYGYVPTKQGNLTGYKTQHSITVKTGKIGIAGELVDAVVKAGGSMGGVINVNTVSFGLKDETTKAVQNELLSLAAADAKAKAGKIAAGVGGAVGKTVSVSTGYVSFPSYRNYAQDYAMGASSEGSPAPKTEVFSEELTVTSSVSASFEILG